MRNSLRLGVLLGGASIIAGATFLIACSDDTSINPGTDAGSDAPITPSEASPGDAGPDTAPPFDGGFVVETFDKVIAKELCGALARCCYGTATPADGGADGGSFDEAQCEEQYGLLGFEGSNTDRPLTDAGSVTLDQLSADTCIKKIKAMSCDLPGSEFKDIRTACFGAYAGTVASGGGCAGSIECKPGQFCKDVDGGPGTCTALRAVGGACGDLDRRHANEACSYRAGGDTSNYCDIGGVMPGTELDQADWKCAAAKGAGSDCATSVWCEKTICNESSMCVTPDRYFDVGCGRFVK